MPISAQPCICSCPRILRPASPPPATPVRHWIDLSLSQSSRPHVAPQFLRPNLKPRSHRVGQHQKLKTPPLYIAPVAHRPCPSPLAVWTLSRIRNNPTVYGFSPVLLYVFVISFRFGRLARHSSHSLLALAFYLQARRLVPPPRRLRAQRRAQHRSGRKFSGVRTLCTTPCGLVAGSIYFEFVVLLSSLAHYRA